MKLTYYIDSVIPSQKANSVHVMKMCQAFTQIGIEVTLVCERDNKKDKLDEVWTKYGITDQFKIERVYVPKFLRKYGHRVIADYSSWLKSKIKIPSDFVYSRSSLTLYFLRNKVRYIYEAHMEPDNINKKIISTILKHRNCVGLVVISNALKKRYLELFPFLEEKMVTVLHDGADVPDKNKNKIAKLKVDNSEQLKIGYIGHLYPGKCMEELIPIARACPNYTFNVVGGTEYWVKYWENILNQECINNILLYGFVDNSEIGGYYRAFDICVLPFSKSVLIGKNKNADIGKWISPLKLFEAMAYGKAIIASRLDTIEEVMSDGEDCILINPGDVDGWKKAICLLANDYNLRKKLGNNAKAKLVNQYTWKIRAEKISTLLNDFSEV